VWEVSHPAFNPEEIDVNSAHRKVMEQILHPNQPVSVRPKLSFLHYWQQVAAILLLPLLILSAYLYFKPASQIAETYQELFTPYGTWSVVNLPDGSKVWLNAGSSLKYPTQFNDKQRVVSMQGEAYFEVESDKEHPFIVKTKQLTVEATGTAFNVNAYAPDHVAAVTLVKGKVAVTLDQKKTISLSPGEKIDYNLATSLYNVNKTNTYKWCSWKDGILIFRDDPLEYVFKRLGQTYNVEFILKDAELGKYSYKATFEGESLNEILRLLEMSAPIRCKEVSNRNSNNEKFEKQRIEVSRIVGK
jgi:ferric-dicitrate binding protein FerR (iron transport regulator)